MLTKVRGVLETLADESLTLSVDPFEIEVLVPEYTRRQLQSKLGQPISLHTILYIEGGTMASRQIPRLVGFLSAIDREFFDIFCSVDGVGTRKALRAMVMPVRELCVPFKTKTSNFSQRFRALARRRPSASSPSCAARSASLP